MKMFLNSNRSFEILCLILGMMQSGLSRELFESWCTDSKNGCIVAGYCVEGMVFSDILRITFEFVIDYSFPL